LPSTRWRWPYRRASPAEHVSSSFVHYAKNNPGKLKYGCPSRKNLHAFSPANFFKIKTGTEHSLCPLQRGALAAITDVIGGHIDHGFSTRKSSLLTYFQGKARLKPLAVTS